MSFCNAVGTPLGDGVADAPAVTGIGLEEQLAAKNAKSNTNAITTPRRRLLKLLPMGEP